MLCDRHLQEMTRITLQHDLESLAEVLACEVHDCTRNWDIYQGYFDVVGGEAQYDKAKTRVCPKDGAAMYLESQNAQTGGEVWRCPHIGCAP